MTEPLITPLQATYKKVDSNVWVLNTDDIPVEKNLIKDQQLVHLAPRSIGGNHSHPRTEWFIGIGELLFVWLDKDHKKHEIEMHPNGEILLIEVPPHLPHAVVNSSHSTFGILYELADGKMSDVVKVEVAHSI